MLPQRAGSPGLNGGGAASMVPPRRVIGRLLWQLRINYTCKCVSITNILQLSLVMWRLVVVQPRVWLSACYTIIGLKS